MEYNDGKESLSDFNEASFQIQRLHNLWLDSCRYSREGNYHMWKWTLDRAWIELSPDAKKKDHSKKTSFCRDVKLYDKRIDLAKTNNQRYYALKKKEEFIRKLQDDVGKGSKRSDSFEDIM